MPKKYLEQFLIFNFNFSEGLSGSEITDMGLLENV